MAVVAKLGTDGELGMRLLGRMQVPGQQPAMGYSRCRIEVEGSMCHGQLESVCCFVNVYFRSEVKHDSSLSLHA